MQTFFKALKKHFALIILLLVECAIIATNLTPGTYLAGWDNIMPEFNFPEAFTRSIFGVWMEYRGLGLYDGMSHIANLMHTTGIAAMSLVLPKELLRYVFVFSMHLAGGLGMYYLLHQYIIKNNKWIALLGSLFYLFNLATIQMFYSPLEGFVIHFASLPWLAWSLLGYYTNPKKRSLLVFFTITFLATPQFFVTPLFIPIVILLGMLSVVFLMNHPQSFRQVLIVLGGFTIINMFWLLPYLYGIPRNAPVVTQAKINQMSSDDIFSHNQAFGDIFHTLSLQGFSLDYEDKNNNNVTGFMMAPWRTHLGYPISQAIMGGIIVVTLIGLVSVLRRPKQPIFAFALMALIGFIFLGNDIPYLRDITFWLQEHVPFFKEAFRFSYTKFSLLYALSYAVLFAFGLLELSKHEHNNKIKQVIFFGTFSMIVFMAAPAFQGNFLYTNLRIQIPEDYRDLFTHMKTQDPDNRIAVLPQPAYWSWKFYEFGYRGSGFLWHGLKQPLLDRAFDPWSATNENYYWELSAALYAKDAKRLESVFRKYDVKYILLDENVVSPNNNRSLFIDESKELLTQIPGINQTATFGKLTLYERTNTEYNTFVKLTGQLPTVNAYTWTDNDVAYREVGDYIAMNDEPSTMNYSYPFRSLFTKRAVDEREFNIAETDQEITLGSTSVATGASILKIDMEVYDSTKTADLNASAVKQCGLLKTGRATAFDTPEVKEAHTSGVNENFLRFDSTNQRGCLSFGIPDLPHREAYLIAVETRHIEGRPLLFSLINETAKHVESENYLPTTTDWNTTYFILPPLAPDGLGYNVYVSNDSIGRHQTINDVRRIRIYQIPYVDLVHLHTLKGESLQGVYSNANITVSHPNPAFYKISMRQSVNASENTTLILSQSFDPGWIAVTPMNQFPYLTPAGKHVLVNNWANGWTFGPTSNARKTGYLEKQNSALLSNQVTIYLFFWPQLLEFLGFALLPMPFLFLLRKN